MQKRPFLKATMAAGLAAGIGATPARTSARDGSRRTAHGPALLTVSGSIGAGNRGPFDPALDQMMAKHKVAAFDRAQTFDFDAIAALPAVTIKPTLEYDGRPHVLKGPLLVEVLQASGAKLTDKTAVLVRAVDGYAAQIAGAEARKRGFIVATHLDGRPLPLGGLGPLWVVYEADRFTDRVAKPLPERFESCPWATYHVEVKEA
jgi:hypothetical protein